MSTLNAINFRTFVYVALVCPPVFVVPAVAANSLPLNLPLLLRYFLLLPTQVLPLLQVETPSRICLPRHPFRLPAPNLEFEWPRYWLTPSVVHGV